jgi:hypothetical protein
VEARPGVSSSPSFTLRPTASSTSALVTREQAFNWYGFSQQLEDKFGVIPEKAERT